MIVLDDLAALEAHEGSAFRPHPECVLSFMAFGTFICIKSISVLILRAGSLTNVSTRDGLFRFAPPLSEYGISPAHLVVENKHILGLEVLFHPVFHMLYIGLGDDGGVFEIIVGIRNTLLYDLEPMYVQGELGLPSTNVSNAYSFYISILHIGLSSAWQMIDGYVDREGFLS